MLLEEQRRRARDVGRGHARAIEDGKGLADRLAQRGGEDVAARRGHVGLEVVAERRQTGR